MRIQRLGSIIMIIMTMMIMMILLVGQDYFEVNAQDKGYTPIFAFGSVALLESLISQKEWHMMQGMIDNSSRYKQ